MARSPESLLDSGATKSGERTGSGPGRVTTGAATDGQREDLPVRLRERAVIVTG